LAQEWNARHSAVVAIFMTSSSKTTTRANNDRYKTLIAVNEQRDKGDCLK